jgi:hypothetical protein
MKAAWAVTAGFAAATLALTWPLAAAMGTSVPHDFGDPLYVCWALAWVGRWMGRVFTEGPAAAGSLWDANIFAPEPNALALSDHFVVQGVLAAPIYWLTGNPLLLTNLWTLATFVVAGVGGYLLLRTLTESHWAGIAAGVVLAFNPFRLNYEVMHLQILSTCWMPFVLLGIRKHLDTGRYRPLAGSALAAIALHGSTGYYLVMFPPFVALYLAWELAARRRLADTALWRALAVWGVAIAAGTWLFVAPYLEMRSEVQFKRTIDELIAPSARIDSYFLSIPGLSIPFILAIVALVTPRQGVKSPSVVPWALATLVINFVLSLGPVPHWGDHAYPMGVYAWLYDNVPGIDVIRVPSRFAVIFLLALGVLAGLGAAAIAHAQSRWRYHALAVIVLLMLVQQWKGPLPLDQPLHSEGLAVPPAYLRPQAAPPELYRFVRTLPPETVLVEFPFSDFWYNARYTYTTTYHWRRTLNGFTSVYPPAVVRRMAFLKHPTATPDVSWQELMSAGATHAIVHENAWHNDEGQRISEWLRGRGAALVAERDGARLFALRRFE